MNVTFTQVLTVVLSLVSCACVVACGVLPALLLPSTHVHNHSCMDVRTINNYNTFIVFTVLTEQNFNALIGFSIGCLLGDVFLHILPQVWSTVEPTYDSLFS
jgi:hypothetical protein